MKENLTELMGYNRLLRKLILKNKLNGGVLLISCIRTSDSSLFNLPKF